MVHMDMDNKQINILFLLLLIISSCILTRAIRIYSATGNKVQEDIASKIIRFHVIANSDSDEDQELKYLLKDTLVQALQPYLKEAGDIQESRNIINSLLTLIESKASRVIEENGFEYSVTASLASSYFPMKTYGDYAFPCGYYEALQVKIGAAEGKNWWCVMFPPLCFVDETYSIVDKEGEEKLKHLLPEEELDAIKNKKVPIKIRFKLFSLIKELFS